MKFLSLVYVSNDILRCDARARRYNIDAKYDNGPKRSNCVRRFRYLIMYRIFPSILKGERRPVEICDVNLDAPRLTPTKGIPSFDLVCALISGVCEARTDFPRSV